jgi:hypothetical protein
MKRTLFASLVALSLVGCGQQEQPPVVYDQVQAQQVQAPQTRFTVLSVLFNQSNGYYTINAVGMGTPYQTTQLQIAKGLISSELELGGVVPVLYLADNTPIVYSNGFQTANWYPRVNYGFPAYIYPPTFHVGLIYGVGGYGRTYGEARGAYYSTYHVYPRTYTSYQTPRSAYVRPAAVRSSIPTRTRSYTTATPPSTYTGTRTSTPVAQPTRSYTAPTVSSPAPRSYTSAGTSTQSSGVSGMRSSSPRSSSSGFGSSSRSSFTPSSRRSR